MRRWGRIESAGRKRIDLHPNRSLAQMELAKWLDRKRRRGYRLRASKGSRPASGLPARLAKAARQSSYRCITPPG